MTITEKVTAIVIKQLGVDESEVTAEAAIIDDLGADSLDAIEIVMTVEEKFGIDMSDEDAATLTRVQDIVTYVEGRLTAKKMTAVDSQQGVTE